MVSQCLGRQKERCTAAREGREKFRSSGLSSSNALQVFRSRIIPMAEPKTDITKPETKKSFNARNGIGMLSKQYSGNGTNTVCLDWAATEGEFEARISLLARWVVDAHAAQQHYNLTLHNFTLATNHGEAHYHEALRALALL